MRCVSRFVRTAKLVAEEEAGRPLFRAFGTAFEDDRLLRGIALASPVNVSIYPFAGRLLAFGEQGLPYELDPESLETRGEHSFARRLNAVSPFSAHPGFDPVSGEVLNFGVSFASDRPTLTLYRFDAAGDLLYRRRAPLDHPYSLHDFGLSRRWAVFYLAPYLLDVEALMSGGATLQQALAWRPDLGSRLALFAREDGAQGTSIPIGERYCLHQINSFELPDGKLAVDVMELDEPVYDDYHPLPDLFVDVEPARPARLIVDPVRGELVERREIPFSWAADFPVTDPRRATRPYRHFWMLAIGETGRRGRKFLDRLVHGDWGTGGDDANADDTWQAAPGCYLAGEPAFIPHPASDPGADGEDRADGLVICPLLDTAGERTSFFLFDARHVARGPLARLHLDRPLHLAFHGHFEPA